MSEKEPFDAVINELRGVIGEAEETGIWDDLIGECKAAIRVLEAAGKIDKNKALSCIGEVYDYQIALGVVRDEVWGEIRALLESLPGKEEQ
jgi:hypothetical protein